MRFTKGLHKDNDPTAQPEGTYRDLLNGIITDDVGSIQREDGTENIESLVGNIVGDIILSDSRIVLFVDDSGTGKIYTFNGSSLNLVSESTEYNFQDTVVGTHTVDNSGDTIIYWTDGLNPPRFQNITNPPVDGSNVINVDIDNLNLFPTIDLLDTDFQLNGVSSTGGNLRAGSHYLAFAYIDEDNTQTDYFLVTQPINVLGPTGYGADDDLRTGKSINFTIDDLDTSYQRLRVSAIYGTEVTNVVDLDIPDSGTLSYSYSGDEDDTVGSLDEVLIDSPIYDKANALEQYNNNLYLGGLEEKELSRPEKEELQRAAINADLRAVTEEQADTRFYQDPQNSFEKRTFKRGEVYGFYVSFIKADGKETEAFHIPGPELPSGQSGQEPVSEVTITNNSTISDSNATGIIDGGNNVFDLRDGSGQKAEATLWFIQDGVSSVDVAWSWQDNGVEVTNGTYTETASDRNTIVNNLVSHLNTEISDFTFSYDGVGNISVEADAVGTQWNGYDLEITGQNGATVIEIGSQTQGGKDPITGAYDGYEVSFLVRQADNIGSGQVRTDVENFGSFNPNTVLNSISQTPIEYGDGKITIVEKVETALNNHNVVEGSTNITTYYSISGTIVGSDYEITLTADSAGSEYDIIVRLDSTETGRLDSEIFGGFKSGSDVFNVRAQPRDDQASDIIEFQTTEQDPSNIDFTNELNFQNYTVINEVSGSTFDIQYDVQTDDLNNDPNKKPDIEIDSGFNSIDFGTPFTFSITNYTGGVDAGPTATISSASPIADVAPNAKNYQVKGTEVTRGFAYWENENETYPNKEPFSSEGLSGQPVRHHHFTDPHTGDSTYDGSGEAINITGIEIENLNINTSNLDEDIVGYKIYYAEKNESNQLVLGQGAVTNGWTDRETTVNDFTSDTDQDGYRGRRPYQKENAVFSEDILTTHGIDELSTAFGSQNEVWGSDLRYGYVRPPQMLVNDIDISGLTFVREVYKQEYDHDSFDQTQIGYLDATVSNEFSVAPVAAKSYIDQGQRNISLSQQNFSQDMDNLFGESKIVLEWGNDREFGERGHMKICDLCQVKSDVHIPFTNQQLVDTGFKGDFDSSGNQLPSGTIFGGDTYIGENYFRSHTLLPGLADGDLWSGSDEDNDWWSDLTRDLLPGLEDEVFGDNINSDERDGVIAAAIESIGNTGSINSLPLVTSTIFREVVESKLNTTLLYSGNTEPEYTYPQDTGPEVFRPQPSEFGDFDGSDTEAARQKILAWLDFYKEADNYVKWNTSYEAIQNVKANFPWSPYEDIDVNNLNRVIRSTGSEDDEGESESFRNFRENDFVDLPRNRGEITNLETVEDTLLVHNERALLRTRGQEELRAQDFEVFLGSGDIFSVKPDEIVSTDGGYAGLQNIHASVNCKYGYFFVDQEDDRIIWLSQQGLQDLSTKQFGLHNFFREEFNSNNALVGYDSNRERIIVSTVSHTLTFNPDLGVWSSFLNYTPDYMIRDLQNLYSKKGNNIYKHTETVDTIYGSDIDSEITYSVPHGFNHKVDHVWFNADNITSSGSINEDIPFNTLAVRNSHQNTGDITLTEYSTDPTDIQNRGNTRKTQGVWRIHDLRVDNGETYLPDWANQRKLEDDYHLVTLKTDTNFILKASGIQSEQTIH